MRRHVQGLYVHVLCTFMVIIYVDDHTSILKGLRDYDSNHVFRTIRLHVKIFTCPRDYASTC